MDKLILDSSGLPNWAGDSVRLLLDDQVGIVNAALERNFLEPFGLYSFQTLASRISVVFGTFRDATSGGLGINANRKYALLGAFGEAVERYCLSYIDDSSIIKTSYSNLPSEERPQTFGLYSKGQYEKNREFVNPRSSSIEWIRCSALYNKDKPFIWWPASLVFVPSDSITRVAETTSTGTSAALSRNRSIRSGLLEVLERDALAISFLNRLPVIDVELQSLPASETIFVQKISQRFKVRIMRILTGSFAPVYCSIIWKGSGRNIHFGIGGGCDFNSELAIRKSLIEALFTFHYSKDVMDLRVERPASIKALYEHFLFYQRDNFPLLPFESLGVEKFRRTYLSFPAVVNRLENAGLSAYCVDLTTRDVRSFGWHVTKVVVPGMCDINPNHNLAREGCARLKTVPRSLGLKSSDDFYSLPHPFP